MDWKDVGKEFEKDYDFYREITKKEFQQTVYFPDRVANWYEAFKIINDYRSITYSNYSGKYINEKRKKAIWEFTKLPTKENRLKITDISNNPHIRPQTRIDQDSYASAVEIKQGRVIEILSNGQVRIKFGQYRLETKLIISDPEIDKFGYSSAIDLSLLIGKEKGLYLLILEKDENLSQSKIKTLVSDEKIQDAILVVNLENKTRYDLYYIVENNVFYYSVNTEKKDFELEGRKVVRGNEEEPALAFSLDEKVSILEGNEWYEYEEGVVTSYAHLEGQPSKEYFLIGETLVYQGKVIDENVMQIISVPYNNKLIYMKNDRSVYFSDRRIQKVFDYCISASAELYNNKISIVGII